MATPTTGPRRLEYMPLDTIQAAPRNPKQHDEDGIRTGITRWGLGELPLLDERTGRLVAGHGRVKDIAARRAAGENPPDGIAVADDGSWLVPVIRGWSSRSDADAEGYLVGSNHLTSKGGWDQVGLGEMLRDLHTFDPTLLTATGFDEAEMLLMVSQLDTVGDIPEFLDATGSDDLDDIPSQLDPETQSNDGDSGEQSHTMSFGKIRVKLTDQEIKELTRRWRHYMDSNGTDWGFALWLCDGRQL